jgi:predicted metal-dependent phosphoesterase TrpH
MMLKADMHVHTRFSKDSLSAIDSVLDAAVARNLGAIAITDHDEVEGAFLAQRRAKERGLPLQVVAGEEVTAGEGDLLVYFVKKRIAPWPLREVLAEVKRQKAVCCAAHPYDFARHGIALEKLDSRLVKGIGCVEVFNARVPLASMNASAMKFALSRGKTLLAGSDAHHPSEVGGAYVEFELEGGAQLDANALLRAKRKIGGRRASPFVRFHSRYAIVRKRLAGFFGGALRLK